MADPKYLPFIAYPNIYVTRGDLDHFFQIALIPLAHISHSSGDQWYNIHAETFVKGLLDPIMKRVQAFTLIELLVVIVLMLHEGRIADARYSTDGCPAAHACGQYVSERIQGMAVDEHRVDREVHIR